MRQWWHISHIQGLHYARNEHEQHTPHAVRVQREGIDGKGAKHKKHTLVGVFLVFGGGKWREGKNTIFCHVIAVQRGRILAEHEKHTH